MYKHQKKTRLKGSRSKFFSSFSDQPFRLHKYFLPRMGKLMRIIYSVNWPHFPLAWFTIYGMGKLNSLPPFEMFAIGRLNSLSPFELFVIGMFNSLSPFEIFAIGRSTSFSHFASYAHIWESAALLLFSLISGLEKWTRWVETIISSDLSCHPWQRKGEREREREREREKDNLGR